MKNSAWLILGFCIGCVQPVTLSAVGSKRENRDAGAAETAYPSKGHSLVRGASAISLGPHSVTRCAEDVRSALATPSLLYEGYRARRVFHDSVESVAVAGVFEGSPDGGVLTLPFDLPLFGRIYPAGSRVAVLRESSLIFSDGARVELRNAKHDWFAAAIARVRAIDGDESGAPPVVTISIGAPNERTSPLSVYWNLWLRGEVAATGAIFLNPTGRIDGEIFSNNLSSARWQMSLHSGRDADASVELATPLDVGELATFVPSFSSEPYPLRVLCVSAPEPLVLEDEPLVSVTVRNDGDEPLEPRLQWLQKDPDMGRDFHSDDGTLKCDLEAADEASRFIAPHVTQTLALRLHWCWSPNARRGVSPFGRGAVFAVNRGGFDFPLAILDAPETYLDRLTLGPSSLLEAHAARAYVARLSVRSPRPADCVTCFEDSLLWEATGLPPGLALTRSGVIVGRPLSGGMFDVKIRVSVPGTPRRDFVNSNSLSWDMLWRDQYSPTEIRYPLFVSEPVD